MQTELYNGIEIVKISNVHAEAKIALAGAHIMSYIPAGGSDLLWMSSKSDFEYGKAIRGGVPVCWPWFGDKSGETNKHGFVRNEKWSVKAVAELKDGSTLLTLELTDKDLKFYQAAFPFTVQMTFYIGKHLEITLSACNLGVEPVEAASALHTYFAVSDISNVKISGLENVSFSNRVAGADPALTTESEALEIACEVDRLYVDTASAVTITDSAEKRVIKVEKCGSNSCVVWNPWIAKSSKMADFAPEGYRSMLCVEAVAAFDDARLLYPGAVVSITQKISVTEL
jgi:D-hexose-6-phosphate mutarotase